MLYCETQESPISYSDTPKTKNNFPLKTLFLQRPIRSSHYSQPTFPIQGYQTPTQCSPRTSPHPTQLSTSPSSPSSHSHSHSQLHPPPPSPSFRQQLQQPACPLYCHCRRQNSASPSHCLRLSTSPAPPAPPASPSPTGRYPDAWP